MKPPPLPPNRKLFCADMVPLGKRDTKLFLLFENKKMKVFEQQGIWDPEEQRWFMGRELQIATIDCPFHEYFYAFVEHHPEIRDRLFRDHHYFLTQSGKLYGDSGTQEEIRPIWADKTRPIQAVIIDHDRKKRYPFGKDIKASDETKTEFYFEMTSAKPAPRYFSRADIKPVKDADGWMRTVLELSQVLPSAKKK